MYLFIYLFTFLYIIYIYAHTYAHTYIHIYQLKNTYLSVILVILIFHCAHHPRKCKEVKKKTQGDEKEEKLFELRDT